MMDVALGTQAVRGSLLGRLLLRPRWHCIAFRPHCVPGNSVFGLSKEKPCHAAPCRKDMMQLAAITAVRSVALRSLVGVQLVWREGGTFLGNARKVQLRARAARKFPGTSARPSP